MSALNETAANDPALLAPFDSGASIGVAEREGECGKKIDKGCGWNRSGFRGRGNYWSCCCEKTCLDSAVRFSENPSTSVNAFRRNIGGGNG